MERQKCLCYEAKVTIVELKYLMISFTIQAAVQRQKPLSDSEAVRKIRSKVF